MTPTFQTAVALAEIEEKEETTHYRDIEFQAEDSTSLVISTTRPELLPACIAIAVNPNDQRYQHLIGSHAISPLFYARIPIIASNTVSHDKGTGIMMVCTFGDGNDVIFWKKHQLPLKQIITKQGSMRDITFGEAPFNSDKPDTANQHYQQLTSLPIKKARAHIVTLLSEQGSSVDGNDCALKGSKKPFITYEYAGKRVSAPLNTSPLVSGLSMYWITSPIYWSKVKKSNGDLLV